jgi:hypothetical protein
MMEGQSRMHEHKHSSHRFSNYEMSAAFPNEDGIDVFLAGARFQHCLASAESDIQMELKESIEASLIEKRKHPQSLKDLSFRDLL